MNIFFKLWLTKIRKLHYETISPSELTEIQEADFKVHAVCTNHKTSFLLSKDLQDGKVKEGKPRLRVKIQEWQDPTGLWQEQETNHKVFWEPEEGSKG